jgi:hypothetical protein
MALAAVAGPGLQLLAMLLWGSHALLLLLPILLLCWACLVQDCHCSCYCCLMVPPSYDC